MHQFFSFNAKQADLKDLNANSPDLTEGSPKLISISSR